MTVRSHGLPLGAGLGSSASFSVAVVASILRLQALLSSSFSSSSTYNNRRNDHNKRLIEYLSNHALSSSSPSSSSSSTVYNLQPESTFLSIINDWAYASEILLQGTPSGLDNTTSCYGGLVKFARTSVEKFTTISWRWISTID